MGTPESLVSADSALLFSAMPIEARQAGPDLYIVDTDLKFYRIDRQGRTHAVLRRGSGPSEQRAVRLPITSGDTVFVFDLALRRVTTVVRGVPQGALPWPYSSATDGVRVPGGFLVVSDLGTPESAGFPLRLLNDDGSVRRSFGYVLDATDELSALRAAQVIAPTSMGCVVAIVMIEPLMDCHDPSGRTSPRRLGPPPPWFARAKPTPQALARRMPEPAIVRVHEESPGKLTVIGVRARPDWDRAPVVRDGAGMPAPAYSLARETVVAVLDTRTGTWTEPLVIPGFAVGAAPGRVLIYREDEQSGAPRLLRYRYRTNSNVG
jgi:hypothetical protein